MAMRKILIIDDDMRYRDAMLPYLQSYDFDVTEASTISQGLKALSLARFDVLIVAGVLPDGSGMDAIKSIRSSGNYVPIAFISGVPKDQSTVDVLKSVYSVAMVKFKPVVPDEVCKELVELLRSGAKPRKPTFTFERKDLERDRTGQQTDFSQYDLPMPKKTGGFQKYTGPLNTVQQNSMQQNAMQQDAVKDLPKLGPVQGQPPNELKQIREQIQLALHSPDRVEFDELLVQVNDLKEAAALYGRTEIRDLMQRIEKYINLFLACQDSETTDSFEVFVKELIKFEKEF